MTTRPPRAPELLLLIVLAAAAISLLHPVTRARLPVPVSLVLILWAGVVGTIAWRGGSRCWRIERVGQLWHLNALNAPAGRPGQALHGATLQRGGFRAGSHVVMHFRDDRDHRLSLVVWRGAVSPETFSRLRLAMLAATADEGP